MDSEQIYPDPSPEALPPTPEQLQQQRKMMWVIILVIVLVIAVPIGFFIVLIHPAIGIDTAKFRDVMIIFMAMQSLLIGMALVVLLVQLARLINLLQNDIRPILESTNETVSTLRGTVTFLGDNLTEPVMKLNEHVAAFGQLRKLLRLK